MRYIWPKKIGHVTMETVGQAFLKEPNRTMDNLSGMLDLATSLLDSHVKTTEDENGQLARQLRSKLEMEDLITPMNPSNQSVHSHYLGLRLGNNRHNADRPRSMPACIQDWMRIWTRVESEVDRSEWAPTSSKSRSVGHRSPRIL